MKSKVRASVPHSEFLSKRLQDKEYAAGYLGACLDDEEETFLVGLHDVADANGGLGALAARTGLNREHLFRMLSKAGNPRLQSLQLLLKAMGIKIAFQAAEAPGKKAGAA